MSDQLLEVIVSAGLVALTRRYCDSDAERTRRSPQHATPLLKRQVSPPPALSSHSRSVRALSVDSKAKTNFAPTGAGYEDVLYRPIDFDKASRIEGLESQILVVELEPGQKLRTVSGSVMYMTEGVEFDATIGGPMKEGFNRMMSGAGLFVTDFTYNGSSGSGKGTVALRPATPSKIMRVSLGDFGGTLICRSGSFVAGSHDVSIEMEWAPTWTAGFFGGHGLVLQKIKGQGDAFVRGGGTLVKMDLEEGETLRITYGSIVAFAPTVKYDVVGVSGAANIMFGGEGLYMATLTGPGTVVLQSMPFDRLADTIAATIPRGGGGGGDSSSSSSQGEGRKDTAGSGERANAGSYANSR